MSPAASPPFPLTESAAGSGPPAIGLRLQQIRQSQRLSLEALSGRAGVSKSMLSQIERNQANPTVAVLWRLAGALGLSLADFLEPKAPAAPQIACVPAHAMPLIRSPDGLCELRILGPIELAGTLEWYELRIAPGGVLASEAHERGSREHLTVQQGALEISALNEARALATGDTARYAVDVPHQIRNPADQPALAWLVVEHGS